MTEGKEATLEELFAEIDGILERMEGKDISREDSFLLYEEGIKKLWRCIAKLDRVEKKMLVINAQGTLDEMT